MRGRHRQGGLFYGGYDATPGLQPKLSHSPAIRHSFAPTLPLERKSTTFQGPVGVRGDVKVDPG